MPGNPRMSDQLNHVYWSCIRKARFKKQSTAFAAMVAIQTKPGYNVRHPVHAYQCPYCKAFHVGP